MNIIVDLEAGTIKDGTEVVFRSPVDCSQVTGLKVYHDNGIVDEFMFADAHGNNVGDIDHLFAENVAVKVILDVTTGMAFVQNADTNAYLEGRFDQLADSIVNEASGSIITLKDSSNRELQGLKLKGKNLLRPSDLTYLTTNGALTEEKTDTGLILTNTRDTKDFRLYRWLPISALDGKTITFSAKVKRADGASSDMLFGYGSADGAIRNSYSGNSLRDKNDIVFTYKVDSTLELAKDCEYLIFWFYAQSGTVEFYDIQIEIGSTATPYVPYFSGEGVTVKVMGKNILNFDEALNANCTKDGDIYTIVNNGNGRRFGNTIKVFIPAGSKLRINCEIVETNTTTSGLPLQYSVKYEDGGSAEIYYTNHNSVWIPTKTVIGLQPYIDFRDENGYTKIRNSQLEFGEVVTAYEPYIEPQTLVVSVPDGLSAGEQFEVDDFAQLHTYKPNTTITNDVGAIMEVEYVADTKAYIDNKFTELQNAILASGANV